MRPPIPTGPGPTYSILDLSPIPAGSSAAQSFRNTLDLARHAERWGYYRYWLAEHHNIPGIASAATSVVIAHVAGGTSHIRVGSGGIMLPNHAPLLIAEQFGTLASLFPDRIDLGVGRAPGGDPATARALRRNLPGADTFPRDLVELMTYFQDDPAAAIRAIPGHGLDLPLFLLGSSDFSARLAADLGLPFAFASHFAPDYLHVALELYRSLFKPSQWLTRPYVMVGLNVFAADTDAEAARLFTTLQQQFLNLVRGRPSQIPPPVDGVLEMSESERMHVERMTRYSVVGSPPTVRRGLEEVVAQTSADEIIVTASIYDHTARLRSFELAARVFQEMNAESSRLASEVPNEGR